MRPSRSLAGIAIAVGLVLVLVLFLLSRSPGANRGAAVPTGSARTGSGGEKATLVGPAASAEAGGSPAGVPAGTHRDEIAGSQASSPTCQIRVVDASSGAPVPDARLWIQDEDVELESTAWRRAMRRSNDVESVLRTELGRELVLDARGEVRVSRPGKKLLLAAARGTLHGEATLRPRDEECVVELRPYHSLAVEVVDRSNLPLGGAHVVLSWGGFDPLENQNDWIAGEDGRVWIPKLEQQLWPAGYRGPVRLTLGGGVASEPELVLFDHPDTIPDAPVRLVAGDSGSVLVQAVDSRGEELELEGIAEVNVQTDSVAEPALPLRAGKGQYQVLESGRALFECVALDLLLEVGIWVEGYGDEWRIVPGPTAPGERVRVLLAVGEKRPIARGRVRGIPAAWSEGQEPGARFVGQGEAPRASFWTRLEEDGPFERPVQCWTDIGTLGCRWSLELQRDGEPLLRASVTPRIDEDAGVIDFGDVVFETPSQLATLRVVDEAGASVPRVGIEIQSGRGWRDLCSDEQGLCRVSDASADLPMSVRASHRDWLASDWVRIDAAGSEVTLIVRRGAVLQGSLLLPPGMRFDDHELEVDVRVEALVHPAEPHELVAWPVEGARFRVGALEPGRACLSVSYAGRALLERGGIELVAGATTEVEPLDLRGLLFRFELAFELAGGAPWNGGHLEIREPGGERSTWTRIGPAASTCFFSPHASVDVWVAARGARPALFEDVHDGDRLVLPRSPSVVLRAPADVRRPELPLLLIVRGDRVQPEDVPFEADLEGDVEHAWLREDGTALLQVPWPGEYELAWSVSNADTGWEFALDPAELQTIQVTAGPSVTLVPTVDVRLDRDALARAVLEAGG